MAGFVEGLDRSQSTLFPVRLDEYVGEDNPVRAVDIFVDGLDLANPDHAPSLRKSVAAVAQIVESA